MLPLVIAAASCQQKGDKVPALDTSYMDLSISPKSDFYSYANGNWVKNNPLKPEYARFTSNLKDITSPIPSFVFASRSLPI